MAAIFKNRYVVQICKTVVCLILCLALIFSYSLQPVHAAATTAVVVVGSIAVITALTALGIQISASLNNTSFNDYCTQAWNNAGTEIQSGVTAAVDNGSGAVQYFFNNAFLSYVESTVNANGTGMAIDGSPCASNMLTQTSSPSVSVPAKTDTKQNVTYPAVTIPAYSLKNGLTHAAAFGTFVAFAQWLGFENTAANNNIYTMADILQANTPFSNHYDGTDYRLATDFQVLAVGFKPPQDSIRDASMSWQLSGGGYTLKFPGSTAANYAAASLYYGTTLLSNSFGFVGSYQYWSPCPQGIRYSLEIPVIMFSYKYNSEYYINVFDHGYNYQNSCVDLFCAQAMKVSAAPTGIVSSDQVYAQGMSAMNHSLQEILDKMKEYGMVNSDGKVATNVPASAKTASDVRTATQAGVLGGTIATAADATANATTNAGRDTSAARPSDLPDLSLPEVIFKEKFPFCLPWDLANSISNMTAPAVPPKFTIPVLIVKKYNWNFSLTLDMAQFDKLAVVSRWGFSLLFLIGLIFITRKMIWK